MAQVNTMPYSRDAEMALLGCFLMDNDIVVEMLEKLTEDDFYQESHKYVFSAMLKVFNERNPVDLVTVSDKLDSEGTLEKAGGIVYLTELAQITPSAANYQSYYDIVKRDSMHRKLIRASRQIIETSMGSSDAEKALAFAEKNIYDISKETERSALLSMAEGDVVDSVIRKFELLQADPNALEGVKSGYKRLDRMTHGLEPGALIVVAARPGMGKTSLAMNLVENISLRSGKTSAVFSLEMTRQEITQRLICSYSNVSNTKAMQGKLEAKDWRKLMQAADKLKKSKIFIDDSSQVTPAQILSKCRRLKATHGLDFVMIDYIQLMTSGDDKKKSSENRTQEVASITRDLKIMAKELHIPVVALSQLRRYQNKEPQLSDLRESGAIEQDANIVIFINNPYKMATPEEQASGKYTPDGAELIIAKNRNGEQGRISMKFIGECTKFVEVDDQNKEMEPPQYSDEPIPYTDEEEEYVAPEDDYIPPEPPVRQGDLKPALGDDELPFD